MNTEPAPKLTLRQKLFVVFVSLFAFSLLVLLIVKVIFLINLWVKK